MTEVDPEIEAISKVTAALSKIDPDSRERVLRWAIDRFGCAAPTPEIRNTAQLDADPAIAVEHGNPSSAAARYKHFAELFSQASPSTLPEKALVAAYWIQVVQGAEDWASQALNSELKQLGPAIASINKALQSSTAKRPQLIIQLKRSGNSKQARKTYKMTAAGVSVVEAMLNAGGS